VGYNDWRLPNKNELESLVERRCHDPAINAAYFPNVFPDGSVFLQQFWSSSPYTGFPFDDHACTVDFGYGQVRAREKRFAAGAVRLVRAGQ
jgi:hypothetical protein